MKYDLLIKNGTIVDGTGALSFAGNVAVSDGKIAAVGEVSGKARDVVDAEGRLVTPGFVDIHTHLDAQITWDPIASSSCWHGVSSIVMGNCGVTFAPCKPEDRDYLARLMESVEDVPAKTISAGMPWTWETYGEYLQSLDNLPKGVNVGGLVGHCAVRLFAMGEDALKNEPATPEEIARMRAAVDEAMAGGALGFSTSRTPLHLTPDGDAVPGTYASADELRGICAALGARGAGVVEAATAAQAGDGEDEVRANLAREVAWMRQVSTETGRPIVFNLAQTRGMPQGYQWLLDAVSENTGDGARLIPQSTTRGIGVLFGFQNRTPFDRAPAWRALRGMPMAEKIARLRDSEYRAEMVRQSVADLPPLDFNDVFVLDAERPRYDHEEDQSLAAHAARLHTSAPDAFIELSLAGEGMTMFNYPFLNPEMDAVERMLSNEHVVLGLGDSGAHCGMIMDASLPTYFLTYWVRERGLFGVEQAIHKLTGEPAALFELDGRGLLREGAKADINIIDFDGMRLHGPRFVHDLPAGAGRYVQKAEGYSRMYVNGELFMQDGEHAGALAGDVLRNRASA